MFLIHLLRFKWSDEAPFPSLSTIARQMGISTAMVRCHARHLEKNSYLKRELRFGETSRYDLQPLFTALEELQTRGINPALQDDRLSEMARST
jgi:DNA-binding MarR family transcriptional regulator